MGICFVSGDHPRHKYFARRPLEAGQLTSWVVEAREKFTPEVPEELDAELFELFLHHFRERKRVENDVFGPIVEHLDIPTLKVTKSGLNHRSTIDFVSRQSPSLVLSYGCHKLSCEFIKTVGCRFINTHGDYLRTIEA